MSYGMDGHLKAGFQSAFGTANVDSYHSIPILSENLALTINQLETDELRGRYTRATNKEGTNDVAGDIAIEGHPIDMGIFLKGWFGQSSGTLTDSVTTHSFKPVVSDFSSNAAVPPFTVEAYRGAGSAHQYYDCCVNELTIELTQGDVQKMTASFVGGKFQKVEKTVAAYEQGSAFTWHQGSISLDGSGVCAISEMSITLNNNLEAKHTICGEKTASRIKRTSFQSFEISGTIFFEDDVQFDKFRSQEQQRLVQTLVGQEITSYSTEMTIDIPSFRLTEYAPPREGPGEIEVSFTGMAEYNSGSGTAIEITLTNTQTAY